MKNQFLNQHLNQQIVEITPQVIAWRRYLHQHPEISFKEYNTSQFVFDTLTSFGGLVVTRPTPTSVMARIIGKKEGRTIALRADMDALPLQEENQCDYKSQNDGVMHACGHDGHTAGLLAVAKILSTCTDDINGEVRFIFQHAEELPPGGASEMVKSGVLEGVDMIFGIHLWSSIPVGKVALINGPMMAAADNFKIEVIGKGGHGGWPHLSIDCITIGALLVNSLQHIISRQIDPLESAVLSITKFIGGSSYNIIPNTAEISGTIRTFDKHVRQHIKSSMINMIDGITKAHNATYKFDYIDGYNAVINNPDAITIATHAVKNELGEEFIYHPKPNMAGEDFSLFLEHVTGCFMFVGAGNASKGIEYPHHHPLFNIDEEALLHSVKIFIGLVKLNNLSLK